MALEGNKPRKSAPKPHDQLANPMIIELGGASVVSGWGTRLAGEDVPSAAASPGGSGFVCR
jgi:hypothetical protein